MVYEKTKKYIQTLMKEGIFSGVSFSFITNGKIENHTLGYAQVEPTKQRLTKNMLFDVASLTKVICTTTVILKLLEQGVLKIDDPLVTYDPAFKDPKVTLRHLLTHTSDIQPYIENREKLSQAELIAAYYGLQAGSQLGKKVVYTDTGTILLGFMLEKIFHKDVVDIFYDEVLRPLGMKDSCFFPKEINQVVPTQKHPTRGYIRGEVHDPKAKILAQHAGNAGLFTTLEDSQKFVSVFLNEGKVGKKQFLKPQTIHWLVTDQTPTRTLNRSIGWDLKHSVKGTLLFHTGYTGTFLLIDPLNTQAFIFLSNRIHPVDYKKQYIEKRDQLIRLYLEEQAELIL